MNLGSQIPYDNCPSEKRTTSVQRMAHFPPIYFTIELIRFESPRSGHHSTLILWTLVDRFRNATVAGFKDRALVLFVLAFLVSVKQQRGPKNATSSRASNSPSQMMRVDHKVSKPIQTQNARDSLTRPTSPRRHIPRLTSS